VKMFTVIKVIDEILNSLTHGLFIKLTKNKKWRRFIYEKEI